MHSEEGTLMDAATAGTIKSIATDAIKILGPAIVAGLLTYKATRSQYETRLKELDKAHEFAAREHWFKYHEDRQTRLAKASEQLNENLGRLLAYAEDDNEKSNGTTTVLGRFVETILETAPVEINTIAREMKESGLEVTEDYERLLSYAERLRRCDKSSTVEVLQSNLLLIMESYGCMTSCNYSVLHKQMEKTFSKYLEV